MYECVVAATAGVGSLGSAELDLAVSLRDSENRAGFADANHLWLVRGVCLAEAVEHIERICFYHPVEHILDFIGGSALVGDDERVEALLMTELQPSHIKLRGGRSAPLTRLEQDNAYGLAGESCLFERLDKQALGIG